VWYKFAKIIIAGKEHIIRKIAEYFSDQGQDPSQLSERLNELDKANKLPIIELRKDGVMFDNNIYTDFLKFTEAVDALHTILVFSKQIKEQKELTKEKIDFVPGKIQVVACNDVNDAIRYGAGTSWCISQPGNTEFQSYKNKYQSTFYYVNDGTRPPEDPLSRVMVDMQANGIVKLTDKNNRTGTIAEFDEDHEAYFDYLRKNGVDTSQFVNKTLTEEEINENELLEYRNVTPNWFEKLPLKLQLKYIGRGHLLTDEQLKFIINLPTISGYLIEQYLNTGVSIPQSQKDMLFGKKQYKDTYDRRRAIAIKEIKEEFGNDKYSLTRYALEHGDFELIDEIINEKDIRNFYDIKAPEEMLRYLFSKGLSADNVAWEWVSDNSLSENFIEEFQDRLGWFEISRMQILSEDFIRRYKDDVYWNYISSYQNLSGDFILEFAKRLDMDKVLRNYPIPEKIIRNFVDRVIWDEIPRRQKLSEDFIKDFAGRLGWGNISHYQTLSEDFIRKFKDKVNWYNISKKQTLSEEFIREFADSVDWRGISFNQTLSEDFIKEFAERLSWDGISQNPKISRQTKLNVYYKLKFKKP